MKVPYTKSGDLDHDINTIKQPAEQKEQQRGQFSAMSGAIDSETMIQENSEVTCNTKKPVSQHKDNGRNKKEKKEPLDSNDTQGTHGKDYGRNKEQEDLSASNNTPGSKRT